MVAMTVKAIPSGRNDLICKGIVWRHECSGPSAAWRRKKRRVDASLVKVAERTFDEGAMRRCFRAKKLSFGYVRRFHALDWASAPNFVVKEYKTPAEGEDTRAFEDVRLQAEAALYAERYNRELRPAPAPRGARRPATRPP